MSNFTQEIVTPTHAQELLNSVNHPGQKALQRPLNKNHVARLAKQMKNSRFQDVSPIHLICCEENELTYLVNGQHTLNAIIQSGVSVALTIRRDIYKTIDDVRLAYTVTDHSKGRRPQDTYRAIGLDTKLGLTLSEIDYMSSAIKFMSSGFTHQGKKDASDLEVGRGIELYAEPFRLFRECSTGGDWKITGRLFNRGYLSIILLTFKFEPEKAREFWKMVIHGNYSGTRFHPAFVLRDKIKEYAIGQQATISGKTKPVRPEVLSKIASMTWSAYINGREIKNFKVPDQIILKSIPLQLAQEELKKLLNDTSIFPASNATDFSKIEYYPKPHLYKYEGNIPLTSVTKFVSSLHPPFDRQGIAEKKARELGIPIQQVLSNWSEAGQKGRELGTTVHDYIQQKLNGIAIDELRYRLNGSTPLELDAFDKYYDRIRQEGMHPTWVEQIIGDIDYKLAGKVDCLFLHPQDGYILVDWKTGKIEEWNTQKFNPPFEKIPCDDLYKYSFQLSLYKLIIERNTDIKISKIYIVHLFGDEYKVYPGIDYGPDLGRYLKGR